MTDAEAMKLTKRMLTKATALQVSISGALLNLHERDDVDSDHIEWIAAVTVAFGRFVGTWCVDYEQSLLADMEALFHEAMEEGAEQAAKFATKN